MISSIAFVNNKDERTHLVSEFYKELNTDNFYSVVAGLEERKAKSFHHGAIYFKNDLTTEEQHKLNFLKSDILIVLNDSEAKKGTIIPLQLIVEYLASNRETIAKDKGLDLIQLENIIDRLELTIQSEDL